MLWFVVLSHSVVGASCYLKTLNKASLVAQGLRIRRAVVWGGLTCRAWGNQARVSQLLSRRSGAGSRSCCSPPALEHMLPERGPRGEEPRTQTPEKPSISATREKPA